MDEMINREVFEEIYSTQPETSHIRPFKSKFVFRVKKEGDKVTKFKVRLVVKGFSQRYGIDYDETYSPTINFSSILTVLHLAVTKWWHITGCDIGNAYLEALTNRELFHTTGQDETKG